MVARFSPGGILLRVLPNSPKDGVAAHLELHDLNVLLGDLPTALEMKFFPGICVVFGNCFFLLIPPLRYPFPSLISSFFRC